MTLTTVYCCRCGTQYKRRTDCRRQGRRKGDYACPKCASNDWSRRPIAEANRLVEDNQQLVYFAINGIKIPAGAMRRLGKDGIVAAAELALIRASRQFDGDFGTQFSTYAVVSIKRHLWGLINAEYPTGDGHVRNFAEDDSGASMSEKVPAPDIDQDAFDDRDIVEAALRTLDPRSRQVVVDCVMYGHTLEVVSKKIGVTRERVRQIRGEAMAKLEKQLAGMGRIT